MCEIYLRKISKLATLGTFPALVVASLAFGQDLVTTESGAVKAVKENGVFSFRGIPYAAPPVGDLRWRPPQKPAPWAGVRSGAEYGHDCMQLPFPPDAAPLRTTPSEDCLYVNVWTPANYANSSLPVMVWIYGGGFVNGGSSPAAYDGWRFARDGVVFVSFNYRLGRFGFFAHPALSAESKDGMLGNYAFMDQIAALQWVQRNIARFGGNPKNVTIFGESAGGMSVHTLLTSPLTQGLFQKAIIESGGGRRGMLQSTLKTTGDGKPSAEAVGVAFARNKGIEGEGSDALKKLRALPAAEIVDAMNMASMGQAAGTYSGPMIDGKIVTQPPQEIYAAATQIHVPLIVGANSMEIGFCSAKTMEELFAPFGDKAAAARALYDAKQTGDVRSAGTKLGADRLMGEPARLAARLWGRSGQPAWQYHFSYVAASMRKEWEGAAHASEIPYVFETVKEKYGTALTDNDLKISRAMHAYWVNFAKTGDPNGQGLPHWSKYTQSEDRLLNFTETGAAMQADQWKERLDLVESIQ